MLRFDSDKVGLRAALDTLSGAIRICVAVTAVLEIRWSDGRIELSADEGDRLAGALTLAGAATQVQRPFQPFTMTYGRGFETRVIVESGTVLFEHLPPGHGLELARVRLSPTEAVDLAAAIAAVCVSLRALYVLLEADLGA